MPTWYHTVRDMTPEPVDELLDWGKRSFSNRRFKLIRGFEDNHLVIVKETYPSNQRTIYSSDQNPC